MVSERYELEIERISEIGKESLQTEALTDYFRKGAAFWLLLEEERKFLETEAATAPLSVWMAHNHVLYEDILPEYYGSSYANPEYAAAQLGETFGPILSALCYEVRSAIPFAYEQAHDRVVVRLELFLEIYRAFTDAMAQDGILPEYRHLKKIMTLYLSDYAEEEALFEVTRKLTDEPQPAHAILTGADLFDLRTIYRYGEYISENDLRLASYMMELPEETISKMADTWTEGYRIGFEATGKDITKKKTAGIIYPVGFERMVRRGMENLEKIGLTAALPREILTLHRGYPGGAGGYSGSPANRQYVQDHSEDLALFLDDELINRRVEALASAYKQLHERTVLYGGPAVIEIFGDEPFLPKESPHAPSFDKLQRRLAGQYRSKAGLMYNEAVIGEERSFTIISFPTPAISEEHFEDIFEETIRINTLDYRKYRDLQQVLIDALDRASFVRVRGRGDNRTDLTVALQELKDPASESLFENCVADVNIPVGEVFTSPKLQGTEGKLHVPRVFLSGLEFRDLEITFENGKIQDYRCGGFSSQEEGRKYIEEHILFHHETLPMGEFAIGTNTTAYRMIRDYGIDDRMDILIAEKTGPHFAVGDTCYSEEEDLVTKNPDGKILVAKDNDVSILRKTNRGKAYFNCHTDITIPYDEIGEITAVCADGSEIRIMGEGRFVLPGTEELNVPLES